MDIGGNMVRNCNKGNEIGDIMEIFLTRLHIGEPKDEIELKSRIEEYFRFCEKGHFKTIPGLCVWIGTTKEIFYKWCDGRRFDKSEEWRKLCTDARQTIFKSWEKEYKKHKINKETYNFLKDFYMQ